MRKSEKMEKIVLMKQDCTGEEFVAMEGYFAGLIDCEFLDGMSYVQIGDSEYSDNDCCEYDCCNCGACECEGYGCFDCCDCEDCDCEDCDCDCCECDCHCCELFEEFHEPLTQEDVLEELNHIANVSIYEVEDLTGKTRFPNSYIVLPNVLLKEARLNPDELRIMTNNGKIEIFADTF